MELRDALSQIADIHLQMARTRLFRGYRSNTTLFSAAVAIATAVAQTLLVPDPQHHVMAYLSIWCSAAVICLTVVGAGVVVRYCRTDSPLERELTLAAVQQFIPCLVVGGLLTYIFARVAWSSVWLLPGLWTILFGMGILASRHLLPREIKWIGAFYLMAGLLSIVWAREVEPFSPWAMGVPFAVGQAAAAAVLYFKLERSDAAA
jgi:hypothetical protein